MKKIRKGDLVVVLAGKDKGRTGIIKRMVGEDRAIVDGINVVKKHMRPNPMLQNPGGIVDKEMSIHVSNLAIFDSEQNRATKVGVKILEDGRKVRVAKVSGTELTV